MAPINVHLLVEFAIMGSVDILMRLIVIIAVSCLYCSPPVVNIAQRNISYSLEGTHNAFNQ